MTAILVGQLILNTSTQCKKEMCLAEEASASSPTFTQTRSCALTAVHAQMSSIFDACTRRWELSVSSTAWIPTYHTALLVMAYDKKATRLHQGTDLVSQTRRPPSSWKQRSWRNKEQDCSQPGQCAGKRSWLQWSLWLDSKNSWELRGISRTIAAATNISKFRCANLWHWPSKTGG